MTSIDLSQGMLGLCDDQFLVLTLFIHSVSREREYDEYRYAFPRQAT